MHYIHQHFALQYCECLHHNTMQSTLYINSLCIIYINIFLKSSQISENEFLSHRISVSLTYNINVRHNSFLYYTDISLCQTKYHFTY